MAKRSLSRSAAGQHMSSAMCPYQAAPPPAGYIAPGAMTEFMTDDWGFFVRTARQYERFNSPYQTVEVHDTIPFGKLFRLDGHFMTSERDEFFYHENLVHVAAVTHPQPERVLIVGGGDGGSAEELLKHPSIKSVTLAEIDMAVVDISRKYLRDVHRRHPNHHGHLRQLLSWLSREGLTDEAEAAAR